MSLPSLSVIQQQAFFAKEAIDNAVNEAVNAPAGVGGIVYAQRAQSYIIDAQAALSRMLLATLRSEDALDGD